MGVLGYGSAAGAAFLFGIQYVPVKKHETHDGSVFQFFLCCGALMGTLLVVIVRAFALDGTLSNVVLLFPGFIGGVFWATSNALVIPLVKIMGLGVGFSMYHVVNLMTGYGIGRFGLPMLHLPPDDAVRPWLQDLGVAVLLVSLVLLLAVEAAQGDAQKQRGGQERNRSGNSPLVHPQHAGSAGGGLGSFTFGPQSAAEAGVRQPPQPRAKLEPRSPDSRTLAADGLGDPLAGTNGCSAMASPSPARERPAWKRLAFSVPLAIAAGVTTGVNAVPFSAWSKDRVSKGLPHDSFVYALSQALGIWMTSLTIYLGFATFMKITFRANPAHSVMRPALAAGVCWSFGNILMLVAIQELGFAAAYALDAVGPIMVASIIAALLGEIQRGPQAILFATAVVLQSLGVAMIAVGNGR